MALIKQANAREIARDAIVLDLGDVRRQGEVMVEAARRKADAILADARAERERILAGAAEAGRQEGRSEGLAEGRRAGTDEGRTAALVEFRAQFDAMSKGWAAALADFEQRRNTMLAEARLDVIRLAAMMAEKVIKRAVDLDPSVVADQLDAVLALVVRPTDLLVGVNPDDRAVAAKSLPELLARFQAVRHVELADDPVLPRGSCVARTRAGEPGDTGTHGLSGGEIDASIPVQLQRIVEALLPAERRPWARAHAPDISLSGEDAP